MKTIVSGVTAISTAVFAVKHKADLFIIRLTNLRPYAAVESIIISIGT